jgi:putative Mg2+ transporter-C (MgtC) family protein
VGELGLALLLSAVIGFEREIRLKSAGLRTHVLVGVGAALFMLISKYGFSDVLEPNRIVLDPSRVAAQIVSGVGFLGAGIIFVRRDSVHGLTTAAAIWVTAAVGASAGAGLPVLAAVTTAIYLVVAVVFQMITDRLPEPAGKASVIRVRYPEGQGILRQLIKLATEQSFAIEEITSKGLGSPPTVEGGSEESGPPGMVEVAIKVHGKVSVHDLAATFSDIDRVQVIGAKGATSVHE